MPNFADWLAHLESLHPKGQGGIELGLERVGRVKGALRQAPFCPVILVGGTNGKGSTCAYLEAIYAAAGYRVGCYTSPHLLAYNERVRIEGKPADDEALCRAFSRVEAARQAAGAVALTYFEFGTLAAWEAFAERRVDVMILEVGLGGRLDAVNVYEADCAIVTGVALDHTDWLGPTREAIGFEKAGIYRAGRPAICAEIDPPATLLAQAAAVGADLYRLGHDFSATPEGENWRFRRRGGANWGGLPAPKLFGAYQYGNAAAALAAVDLLQARLPTDLPALRRGLAEASVAGRFEVVPGRPLIVLDVAHNPQAVAVLADNLERQGGAGRFARTLAMVGMLADKDVAGALLALRGRIDAWFLADLDVPRGAPASLLAEVVARGNLGGTAACFTSPADALAAALGAAGENDRIVAFGSFHTVAAAMRALHEAGRSTVLSTPSPGSFS